MPFLSGIRRSLASGGHQPAMDQPQIKNVELVSPHLLRLEWKDGVVCTYTARELRLACPCAKCIDEHTRAPLLDPVTVALDIHFIGAEPVGRYGLSFTWSDGHRTGIFAWPMLRELGAPRSDS